MAITIDWDDPAKHIIRCTVEGRWTWEELSAALARVNQMTRSIVHVADGVIDLTKAAAFPGGNIFSMGSSEQVKDIAEQAQAGDGAIVLVKANRIIRGMYPALSGLIGAKARGGIHFVDTLDEARNLLAEMRTEQHRPDSL
jgi:hypothetical protein